MNAKRERAVWGPAEETVLLELFRQARNDPEVRSDRGVKARGWLSIVAELNRRCGRNFDKDQLKSKYARLMQEYELYKSVGGLLTSDNNPLNDKDWEQLIRERPKNAPQLRQFRENGFAHAKLCSLIAGDAEDPGQTAPLPPPPADMESISGKRGSSSTEDLPDAKKARLEGKRMRAHWGVPEEKLLLYLYLRARNNADMRSDKGIKARGWHSVVADLNTHCKTNFDKEQCKSKYSRLMQEYASFKNATGWSGTGTPPQTNEDWNRLLRERPEFGQQLREFKDKGFVHAETCSLITGDSRSNDLETSSVNDFLPTGANPTVRSGTSLPFLLPATTGLAARQTASPSPAETLEAAGLAINAAASASATGGVDPAFFTTELRDNLNVFLKTATTYLAMLIDERNGQ